jgi:hypothetical protein
LYLGASLWALNDRNAVAVQLLANSVDVRGKGVVETHLDFAE